MSVASILSQAPAAEVIAHADGLLQALGPIDVMTNRTGIVMLPAHDSVTGVEFFVGEVLVTEAHIRLQTHGVEGYGAVLGRDTQHALAVALLDAALRAGLHVDQIQAFAATQAAQRAAEDAVLLKRVEATRVSMETF
jgi:alpha-D-ribose 1-methylphosphonate 5-triphosphate synthase subunit PhnG